MKYFFSILFIFISSFNLFSMTCEELAQEYNIEYISYEQHDCICTFHTKIAYNYPTVDNIRPVAYCANPDGDRSYGMGLTYLAVNYSDGSCWRDTSYGGEGGTTSSGACWIKVKFVDTTTGQVLCETDADNSDFLDILQININGQTFEFNQSTYDTEDININLPDCNIDNETDNETTPTDNETPPDDSSGDVCCLTSHIDAIKDAVDDVNSSVLGAKDTLNDIKTSVNDIKDAVDDVNSSVLGVKDAVNNVNNSVLSVKNSVDNVNNSVQDVKNSVDNVNNSIQDLKNSANNINNSVQDVKNSVDDLKETVKNVVGDKSDIDNSEVPNYDDNVTAPDEVNISSKIEDFKNNNSLFSNLHINLENSQCNIPIQLNMFGIQKTTNINFCQFQSAFNTIGNVLISISYLSIILIVFI